MNFEKKVSLYLDENEVTKEVTQFLLNYNIDIKHEKADEGIISIGLIGRYIDLGFIFELEDTLDKRITLCNRYFGSAETIRSLGLD